MKIKKFFSRRAASLLLVFRLACSVFPTGALAAEATEEPHIHTVECTHEEVIVEITPVDETTEDSIESPIESKVTPASGFIGESAVSWTFDTESGKLYISGSGDCDVFTSVEDQPWAEFRTQITEVWFMDMETVSISNLAYWFDGCSALAMAEIPYTTPMIGTRAFADCPNLTVLQFYYSDTDNFTIVPGAFFTPSATETSLRIVTDQKNAVLNITMYDWEADNRTIHMADAYGLMALSGCSLSDCSCSNCDWYYNYVYMDSSKHNTWVCCTMCSAQFLLSQDAHSYGSDGYCSACGHYNSSYDTSVCYHNSSYYSWSGCTYYEYCSDCGECLSSGVSHGSTYTEWSGCNWYNYCRDCGQLIDSGTSHGTYSYGAWEYYSSTHHRRFYSCNDCGQGSYSYGSHSRTTKYTMYNDTQHQYGSYCSACNSYVGSTSYQNHSFSYGSWSDYSSAQHRRTKSCSSCGYSTYEYANHSLSYGSWTSDSDTQHKRTVSCICGHEDYDYEEHADSDSDGYCDECSHPMTLFSVTVPADMSLTVANDGCVYSATNAAVINNSSHGVEITSVTVTAGSGWTIVPYDCNMANEKVDSKLIGFCLNDAVTTKIGTSEKLSLPTNWTIDRGDTFPLVYDATVSATSDVLSNEQVLTLVFVINWAPR